MNKKVIWSGLSLLLAAAMLLASCGSTTSTTTPGTTTTTTSAIVTTTAAGATVLTVTESNTVKTYSMAALQALPSVSGNGGFMGKGGSIAGPVPLSGCSVINIARRCRRNCHPADGDIDFIGQLFPAIDLRPDCQRHIELLRYHR